MKKKVTSEPTIQLFLCYTLQRILIHLMLQFCFLWSKDDHTHQAVKPAVTNIYEAVFLKSVLLDFGLDKTFALYYCHQCYYPS